MTPTEALFRAFIGGLTTVALIALAAVSMTVAYLLAGVASVLLGVFVMISGMHR